MSTWRIKKPSTIICVVLAIFLLIYVANVSVEQRPGRNFLYYGYQFEAPWTDVKREAHLRNEAIVYFSNNLVMVLHDPAQSVNFLKVLTSEGTKDEVVLKRLWGEEATRSNYALHSKILNLTPRDLHLSPSRQKMVSVQSSSC